MAQQKVLGIETEFGIVVRGAGESNPVTASSLLINAYVNELERQRSAGPKVAWDFEDESPGNDARGPSGPSSPPDVETHLVNAVLTNGARYYVDHAHPELSTPECADARSIVVYDRAAEEIGVRALLVHAKDDRARDFYLRLAEFESSPTDPLHLFLLMKDLRRAIVGN